ncbi:hypothetical protein [Rubrolithibacter danxiaensis]|uniref:hypothetical protein n=1 Tax=Rubrolithibacter danxiaensis TaxID=3390805 RepID=UPI003BF87977
MEGHFFFEFKNYIYLTSEQHEEILEARNHLEVRCWMDNTCLIEHKEHYEFVNSLKTSSQTVYFAAYKDNTYCGSISLVGLGTSKVYYGYFSSPNFFGTRNGIRLYYYGLSFLVSNFNFPYIFGKIYKTNKRSIKLGLKFGFTSIIETEDFIEISRPTSSWPLNLTEKQMYKLLLENKMIEGSW